MCADKGGGLWDLQELYPRVLLWGVEAAEESLKAGGHLRVLPVSSSPLWFCPPSSRYELHMLFTVTGGLHPLVVMDLFSHVHPWICVHLRILG